MLSAAQVHETLAKLDQLVVAGVPFAKAVATSPTEWFNVVREDLEDAIIVAAPDEAPLSTRFSRIGGEGTLMRCPNVWRHTAARCTLASPQQQLYAGRAEYVAVPTSPGNNPRLRQIRREGRLWLRVH